MVNEQSTDMPKRNVWVVVVDVLIVIMTGIVLGYSFFISTDKDLKVGMGILIVIVVTIIVVKKLWAIPVRAETKTAISKLVLLDEDGESVKEWYIHGETSLLVGKNSSRSEVDIDLSDTEYAALINKHHALLNQVNGLWFLEDMDSNNGIGLRKFNRSTTQKLEPEQLHRIEAGDLIYIANTRILVR